MESWAVELRTKREQTTTICPICIGKLRGSLPYQNVRNLKQFNQIRARYRRACRKSRPYYRYIRGIEIHHPLPVGRVTYRGNPALAWDVNNSVCLTHSMHSYVHGHPSSICEGDYPFLDELRSLLMNDVMELPEGFVSRVETFERSFVFNS